MLLYSNSSFLAKRWLLIFCSSTLVNAFTFLNKTLNRSGCQHSLQGTAPSPLGGFQLTYASVNMG